MADEAADRALGRKQGAIAQNDSVGPAKRVKHVTGGGSNCTCTCADGYHNEEEDCADCTCKITSSASKSTFKKWSEMTGEEQRVACSNVWPTIVETFTDELIFRCNGWTT
jgi:hypothetical protein